MRYGGVIVLRPPERLSYDPRLLSTPERLTREQQLELTRSQVLRLLPRLVGKPMRTEHGRIDVGRVVEAFIDPHSGNACVRFELHDTPVGQAQRRLIDAGYTRQLSLSHYLGTDEPTEVSICFEGARKGADITEGLNDKNSFEYKPPGSGAPAERSVERVLVQASAYTTMSTPNGSAAGIIPGLLHPSQLGQPEPGQLPANPHKMVNVSGGGAPPPVATQPQQNGRKRRRVQMDGQEVELEMQDDGTEVVVRPDHGNAGGNVAAQGQQQPLITATNTGAAAAAATGAPPPPAETKAEHPAATGTAASERKLASQQILQAMAENGGRLDPEQQTQLIEMLTRNKRDREALQAQLQETQRKLAEKEKEKENVTSTQKEHLLSVLMPFFQTYVGQELTAERQKMLADAVRSGTDAQALSSLGPLLIQASTRAVDQHRRAQYERSTNIDPRVRAALQAYNQAEQTQSFASQSYGWQPDAAMQQRLPPPPLQQQQQQPMAPPAAPLVQGSNYGYPQQQQKPVDPFEHLEREAAKVPNPVTLTYDRAGLYERAAAVPDPQELAARNRQIRLPDHVLRL